MNQLFGLMNFDTTTKADEGQWLALRNPATGQPTAVEIKLAGPDSRLFNRVIAELGAEAKQATALRSEDLAALITEQEGYEARLLAGLTLDWRNVPDAEGRVLTCTRELAEKLYATYPEIRAQVRRFLDDKRNWLLAIEENLQPGRPVNSASAGTPTAINASSLTPSSAKAA